MTDTRPPETPPFAKGRTAEVYGRGESEVLKLFYDWVPDSWIERELEIARALSGGPLPVPRFIEAATVDGRRGLVFERIAGRSMVEELVSRPWRGGRLAGRMAALHATIHAEDGGPLEPLRGDLAAMIAGSEHVPEGIRREVLRRLEGLPDDDALCHFDFHPGQVMMAPSGPVILDWMGARRGDPAADVARTLVLLTFGEVPDAGPAARGAIGLIRRSFRRRYLARYMALRPSATMEHIEAWTIPVAAARLHENVAGERQAILEFLGGALKRG